MKIYIYKNKVIENLLVLELNVQNILLQKGSGKIENE